MEPSLLTFMLEKKKLSYLFQCQSGQGPASMDDSMAFVVGVQLVEYAAWPPLWKSIQI